MPLSLSKVQTIAVTPCQRNETVDSDNEFVNLGNELSATNKSVNESVGLMIETSTKNHDPPTDRMRFHVSLFSRFHSGDKNPLLICQRGISIRSRGFPKIVLQLPLLFHGRISFDSCPLQIQCTRKFPRFPLYKICDSLQLTQLTQLWNTIHDLISLQPAEPPPTRPRGNSVWSQTDLTESQHDGSFGLSLSLDEDLDFLRFLVAEGDVQSAVAIGSVLWDYLRGNAEALRWMESCLQCLEELAAREEFFEGLRQLRQLRQRLDLPSDTPYCPEINFQTATETDLNGFSAVAPFFATPPHFSSSFLPPAESEIPFVATGFSSSAPVAQNRVLKKGKARRLSDAGKRESEAALARSRSGEVNSFCSVCHSRNGGLVAMCLRCGHGGHLRHVREWFAEKGRKCAIPMCSCHCVFAENGGHSQES